MKIAFYKAKGTLFDRAVRWWTRGPYAHCEIILDEINDTTALCASASLRDGGVRMKIIALHPARWDVYDLAGSTRADEQVARRWFREHDSARYDVAGLFGFVWRPHAGRPRRWFCSEACAAALRFRDPWRFCPNTLHAAMFESSSTGI